MRGSIIKRSESSYAIVLNLGKDLATGKRKQQWVTVRGNRREAERRLTELLHQLNIGTFIKPSRLTVKEYLQQWLQDYCVANLSPRTHELYSYICEKHLIPHIGLIPLTELKPSHLQHLYSDKLSTGRSNGKGGLSNRTVQIIHITLHKALQNAVKTGLLVRNAAGAVDTPRIQRREMHVMSEMDLHIFLEYAKDTPYYTLFYTSLFTGMRRAELLALRWSDIDLELCQLSVTRSMQYIHGATPENRISFKEPKTAKSRRLIALSPSTVITLREHKAKQAELTRISHIKLG